MRRALSVALCVAALSILSITVGTRIVKAATTRVWGDGTANWSIGGDWIPSGVPAAGDTVSINIGGAPHVVTYDYAGAAITLASLTIDKTDAGTTANSLSIPAGNLTSSIENVGYNGRGTVDQMGGINTIAAGAGYLDVGVFGAGNGSYNLGGTGALVANTNEYIGDIGTGVFHQNGGTNTVNSGNLYVGYNAAGSGGTYMLDAGSLSAVGARELVGYKVTGNFIQSGGTNFNGGLFLGSTAGVSGTYTLSGGILNIAGFEFIGANGTGTFIQTGGTNNQLGGGDFEIGEFPGSTGTYSLSGGSIVAADAVVVGTSMANNGKGTLTVSGSGVLTILNNGLGIGDTTGTSANLSGGTINTPSLNVNAIPSHFNWTSGTLNLTSSVTWDSAAGGTTTSAAFGASRLLGSGQTLIVTGNEILGGTGSFSLELGSGSTHQVTGSISVAANGTLTQDAGSTLSAPTITQTGGTVNGTLLNQTSFVYQSGQFNGRLVNQGAVNLGPSFTAGDGIENDVTMTAVAGQTITANRTGFDNHGTLSLSDATAVLGGTVLNNTGLVRGEGQITAPFNNNPGGEVRAETGKWLKFTAASGDNAGRITLLGGIAEFSQPLTNGSAGQILGSGTLVVGGTGLGNQGQLIFSSGIGYVFGDVNNDTGDATKGVTISGNSNVTFWDDVTHVAGSLFKVQSGSSVTFFGSLGGTGAITGGGNVYLEADLTPGFSPASVSYDANVHIDSTAHLKIELGGVAPGNQYDQVHVSQQLSLDGALVVSLINSFTPAAGQSFDILDWGTLAGSFSSIQLPTLGGSLAWNTSQLYTAGILSVVSTGLVGDYNHNGIVDAADYVVWRDNQGTNNVLANDPLGGTIGTAQYNQWRAHFGQTAGGGSGAVTNAAVPEPTTLVLLFLGAASFCRWRSRSAGKFQQLVNA